MKKILLPLLLLSLSLSCVTEKQRRRICNNCPVTSVTHDSIIMIKRDTTIYITHREVEYRDTIICDQEGKVNDFRKVVSGGGVKATVSLKDNKLKVKCETDSLYQVIKGLLIERDTWSRVDRTKVIDTCKLDHRTKFDGFTFWWFYISAGWLALRYVLKYFKVKIPFIS